MPASSNSTCMEGKFNLGCTLCKELRASHNGKLLTIGSMMGEASSEVEGREVALDDVALNDTALNDTALNDMALNDMALDDMVLDDAVLNVGVARLPSTDLPNCRVLPSCSKWTWISGEGAEWLGHAHLGLSW
jgi:hypothetical protein